MATEKFVTPGGVTVPAVTTDQMREIDRVAIEEVGPNLYQMMENAGRNLALTAIDMLGSGWQEAPIVVLAGTGGNGGGGIAAARHLANRGATVSVVVSDPAGLGPVPAAQYDVYRGTSGTAATVAELGSLPAVLVVDAVIGYSLRGAPIGVAAEMIEWARRKSAPVLALDVPSGVDSTTGEAVGSHVAATRTLTLALPKTGLDVETVGELWLGDIGIPGEVYRRVGILVALEIFGAGYRVRLNSVSKVPVTLPGHR